MSAATRRNHLIWIGPLVGFAAILSYFMVFARFPDLRDFPWVNFPMALLGVGLSATAVWRAFRRSDIFRGKILAPLGLVISLIFGCFFLYYIFGLSSLPGASDTTLQLTEAPEFSLTSSDGTTVRLSDFQGRNVALIFYRGFW